MRNLFLLLSIPVLFVGCSQGENVPNSSVPPFIMDAHVHYRPTAEWETSFLDVYTRYNATACLMVRMEDLERGIEFAREHSDRIIPYAMIEIDSPDVLEDIRQVHSMGFKGLGEIFARNQWDYDDLQYEPIWSLAEELGMVVALHTGIHGSGNFARMRPSFLGTIASSQPDLTVIGLHFGNPWYNEAAEAARLNNNLYFELSGSSLIKKDHDPDFWRELLWWTPHIGKRHVGENSQPAWESIVFATDEPPDGFEDNIIRFNKVLDAAGIDDETRAKMYGQTLAEIHGLEPDSRN
ncbi:MAG: amidohydrolase family protein [Balneolaceae bacterium]